MIRVFVATFSLANAGLLLAIAYGAGPTVVLHPGDPAVRLSLTLLGLVAVVAAGLLSMRSPS